MHTDLLETPKSYLTSRYVSLWPGVSYRRYHQYARFVPVCSHLDKSNPLARIKGEREPYTTRQNTPSESLTPPKLTHAQPHLTTPSQSNTHQWIASLHPSPFRLSLTLVSPSPLPVPLMKRRGVSREVLCALSRRRHGPKIARYSPNDNPMPFVCHFRFYQ
jgi:hypothetical protein